MSFPKTLVNDVTPPQIIGEPKVTGGANGASLTWDSNEFTQSTIEWGTQPGAYTSSVNEVGFTKRHTVTLPGITAATRYYYKITQTDLSANQQVGTEKSFVIENKHYAYLPLVRR
jgi:hypothetical protein